MIFGLITTLLGKITLMLVAALGLDGLLHRKWLLSMAAIWNAVLLAIVVLPLAMSSVPKVVLPLIPRQTLQLATALPSNSQQPTMPNSVAGPGERPAKLMAAEVLPDLNDKNQPQIRTDSAPEISNIGVWNGVLATLGWVYVLGIAIALLRLVVNLHAVHALRCRALLVTKGTWHVQLEHWKSRLNLTESAVGSLLAALLPPVRLLQSDRIEVPVAFGVTQRAIVIPSRIVTNASLPMVDSILAHELAHIARADYAWQILQQMVQAFLWFHPLWWISARRIAFIRLLPQILEARSKVDPKTGRAPSYVKIAPLVGTSYMTVKRALGYDRLMKEAGMTEPFRELTERPESASRWHPRTSPPDDQAA